jgi:outer membrane protein assembly factor BamB
MKKRLMIGALLTVFSLGVAQAADSWPQWGGPNRDFTMDARELSRNWGDDGPREIWSRSLGGGFAGIVSDGKSLYTSYREGDDEIVVALDPRSGKTRWEHRYAAPIPKADNLSTQYSAGPNGTPLLVDGKVVTLGFMGHATCVDAKTGKLIWSHALGEEFEAKIPLFGHATSPLALGGRVLFVAGGLLAFDLDSGDLAWQNRDFQSSYGSPLLVSVGDGKQIVTPLEANVAGFDPQTGKTLWYREYKNEWGTILTSPLADGSGRVFFSTSQIGGVLIDPAAKKDDRQVWQAKRVQVDHSNAVRAGDLMFASVGEAASFLTATSLTDGTIVWKKRGFATANLLRVGEEYLLLDFDGELALVELSGEGMNVVTQATVNDKRTWTPPTLLGTTLYFRDEARIVALDLSAGKAK